MCVRKVIVLGACTCLHTSESDLPLLQRELATQTHEFVAFLSEQLVNEGTCSYVRMIIHVHTTF